MTPGIRPTISEEEIATGKVTCQRCGRVTPVKGTTKNYTSPNCPRCKTAAEYLTDLGCERCNPKAPLCLAAPSVIACPRGCSGKRPGAPMRTGQQGAGPARRTGTGSHAPTHRDPGPSRWGIWNARSRREADAQPRQYWPPHGPAHHPLSVHPCHRIAANEESHRSKFQIATGGKGTAKSIFSIDYLKDIARLLEGNEYRLSNSTNHPFHLRAECAPGLHVEYMLAPRIPENANTGEWL
jgi:hypothetical protein